MRLTRQIREELATKLTLKAIELEAAKLANDLEKLNTLYWSQHDDRVASVLPEVERVRHPELIKAGIATCVVSVIVRVGDNSLCAYFTDEERTKTLLLDPAMAKLYRFFYRAYSGCYRLQLTSPATVLRLNDMEKLEGKMAERATALRDRYAELVKAAFAYRSQVSQVLSGIQTLKQLEDMFPEAAKLAPTPTTVKDNKGRNPKEQVDIVRRMLAEGVPPVLDATSADSVPA